jgi:hypothetical protein
VYALTGRPPHGSGEAVRRRVVLAEPELDGIVGPLRDLVARCLAKNPEDRPRLDLLLAGLLEQEPRQAEWPPPTVALSIKVRTQDLIKRRKESTSVSVPSCLLSHAQALLDAGLTDAMVAEAVVRGDA